MKAPNRVVASVGDLAVVKQEIINGSAENFQGGFVVFYDGLVGRVGACHHERFVFDLVEEHVVQTSVGQHDTDVVQVGRN